MSFGRDVFWAKCLLEEMSFGRVVFWAKCLLGEMSFGRDGFGRNVPVPSHVSSTECPKCGKVFSRKDHLVQHHRSIHEGIKYPCNQCDYQATEKAKLRQHIAGKHSDTILQCELCGYQTKWRVHYNAHKKTHKTVSNSEY